MQSRTLLRDLVARSRSYRRFDESEPVSLDTLRELVDLARLAPSASNRQPLKYILSADRERNELIFPCLGWAGFLRDWGGPAQGERPTAYIVILGDTEIRNDFGCDHGIAAQTIMLGATEKGLGGCIIGSVKREALRQALSIPPQYEVLLVLALGKPAERVVIEPMGADGDIKYWRDQDSVHHVPKRSLEEIIIG